METHAFGLGLRVNAPEGQQRFRITSILTNSKRVDIANNPNAKHLDPFTPTWQNWEGE
jgi:hypothetical protein